MSDAFFEKLFGDSEPGHLGTGWISGTASVFFGLLGLGGALCLHFPQLLTLPDARAIYPIAIIRLLIQAVIVLGIVLGAISGFLRQRKVLAVTGVSLGLLAAVIGGGSTPLPDEVQTKFGLGLDWFLLDLFVMTIVFLPVERFWPLHPDQKTFRPQWTTDLFYFVATHLPAQLMTFLHADPGQLCVQVAGDSSGWPNASGACRFSSSFRWPSWSRISRNTRRIGPFTGFRCCGAFMRSITPLKRWIGWPDRVRTTSTSC